MEQKKIEFKEDIGEDGFYSDTSMISHNPSKIFIDFKQTSPRLNPATRDVFIAVRRKIIILDPVHAKMLVKSLEDNINKYEAQFGEIKLPELKEIPEQKIIPTETTTSYIG